MVGINRGTVSDLSAPFGGARQSGLGRDGAHDGLRAFQETQYLSVDGQPLQQSAVQAPFRLTATTAFLRSV